MSVKGLAGHHFLDERAETVVLLSGPFDDGADRRPVREPQAAPQAVGEELLRQATRHPLRIALEERLEFANVPERFPARQLAAGIDRQALLVSGRQVALAGLLRRDGRARGGDAVPVAPAADRV